MTAMTMYAPDYANYTEPAFRAEFTTDMERVGPVQRLDESGHLRLRYDPRQFDFRALVGDALAAAGMLDRAALRACGDRLEQLHELIEPGQQAMDGSQQSGAARALYEMPAAFAALYERLLAEVVVPALGIGPAHFQRTPTFRVFFPNAPGYPGATSYHHDIMLGHNPREVNVFVPLVACEASRSLLLAELQPSLDLLREYDWDFAAFGRDTQTRVPVQERLLRMCPPVRAEVGDIVVFDPRCVHAGPHNKTAATRVTFDTRVLPVAELRTQRNAYQGRGRRRADFAIGQYFSAHAIG